MLRPHGRTRGRSSSAGSDSTPYCRGRAWARRSGFALSLCDGILYGEGTVRMTARCKVICSCRDLFGSQIQGDLIGASQWRIYQGVAKEFRSATSGSFP